MASNIAWLAYKIYPDHLIFNKYIILNSHQLYIKLDLTPFRFINQARSLPLLALALVGLALRSTRCLGLAERISALVEELKVLAGRVGAGSRLRNVRVLLIARNLEFKVGGLLGEEATSSDVEKEDWGTEDSSVLDGRLGKLVRLSHVSFVVS